jgi:hypothetical protein
VPAQQAGWCVAPQGAAGRWLGRSEPSPGSSLRGHLLPRRGGRFHAGPQSPGPQLLVHFSRSCARCLSLLFAGRAFPPRRADRARSRRRWQSSARLRSRRATTRPGVRRGTAGPRRRCPPRPAVRGGTARRSNRVDRDQQRSDSRAGRARRRSTGAAHSIRVAVIVATLADLITSPPSGACVARCGGAPTSTLGVPGPRRGRSARKTGGGMKTDSCNSRQDLL